LTEEPALTKNQAAVFDALNAAGKALTAYEILDAVRDAGIRAPVQVYRALDKLAELGCVHRIESLNAFVACAHGHPDTQHHEEAVAFAICDDCGSVAEIPLPAEVERLNGLTEGSGFKTDHAVLELHGHCAPCRRREHRADA